MFDRSTCFEFGLVTKPHGLKGFCILHLDVDDPDVYTELESVLVEQNGGLVPFFMTSIQMRGNKKALVKFEGIDTIDQVKELVNAKLFLPLDFLPKLSKGQFYFHDVIGYTVVDENLGELGEVKHFYDSSSQVLLDMEYKEKSVLIPVVDHVVLEADHKKKYLKVNLPEGLLELYLENDDKES